MTNSLLTARNSLLQGNACTKRGPEIGLDVTCFSDRLCGFRTLLCTPLAIVFCSHFSSLISSSFHSCCAKRTPFIVTGCLQMFKDFLQRFWQKCSCVFHFVSQQKNELLKNSQKTAKNRPLQMLDYQHFILLRNGCARKLRLCCATDLQSKSHCKRASVLTYCTTDFFV
jgi:hypothetical protein